MIWVPIVFLCLAQQCGFMQGTSTYTKAGCEEQLVGISQLLGIDPRVITFEVTCISVQSA
jgi:hypothetical protein